MIFSTKILVKPRQMELLEDQFKMLNSKTDSLSQEFGNIRKMLAVITNDKHLSGLEGVQGKQVDEQQMREEEIKAEIASITIAQGLKDIVKELKQLTETLHSSLKAELVRVSQFSVDFPDIYVIETDQQKKERL